MDVGALSNLFKLEVIATSAVAYAVWTVLKGIYNVYLHPLAKFPGPKWATFSVWWKINLEVLQGKGEVDELFKLHEIYGDVVRIGPNELHFSKPTAYHEIYNQRNRWKRDPALYHFFSEQESLLTMMEYSKAKKRKDILLPLFSRQAILDLQSLIQETADKMCANISKQVEEGKTINIFNAYRCFALDGIASFCFGTSMNATEAPDLVSHMVEAMHASMPMTTLLRSFPTLQKVVTRTPGYITVFLQPQMKGLVDMRDTIKARVRSILKNPDILKDAPHPTIFHELLNEAHGHKIPNAVQLGDEALLMVFAGTDTSSNTLTLATIHVLSNPDVYRRLKDELLDAWPVLTNPPRYEDFESLPFMRAVIKESLRMLNGVITPMTRIVPRNGAQISGRFIPGGTIVGISNCFVHTDSDIFPEPHVFKPDRWLGGSLKDGQSLDHWLVAFSKGPRSCLGVNLGWCELIIGLANVFRRFDLELDGISSTDLHWKEYYIAHYEGPDLKLRVTLRMS